MTSAMMKRLFIDNDNANSSRVFKKQKQFKELVTREVEMVQAPIEENKQGEEEKTISLLEGYSVRSITTVLGECHLNELKELLADQSGLCLYYEIDEGCSLCVRKKFSYAIYIDMYVTRNHWMAFFDTPTITLFFKKLIKETGDDSLFLNHAKVVTVDSF